MTSKERVALVTGAGRGIGRAIAERFAADGYRLELGDLDAEGLAATTDELGAAVVGHAVCDLRDRTAMDAWLADVRSRHGSLDVLVMNAGVGGPDPDDDAEALAHHDHVMSVNATAPLRIVRALHDLLPDDGTGRVVVVCSVLGKMGVPGFAAYCASKAAAVGVVRGLALDLARHRVAVNGIAPGWTDTAMARQGFEALAAESDSTPEEARELVEQNLPLGRIVRPDEVAALAAFLAGHGSGGMSGQVVTMSAGDLSR